jgi:hypothetical protein
MSRSGFAAEMFVAAELSKQGHLVTITFGDEKAIDLLVVHANDPKLVRSIDVKGLAQPADWPMSGYLKKQLRPDIYVFRYLNKPGTAPEYFVVPKAEVDQIIAGCKDPNWIGYRMVGSYKDKWDLLWV